MITSNSRIESIQALRGIAALMVVVFHLMTPAAINGYEVISKIFSHGYIGVDIFFIISGFIMVLSTSKIAGGIASGYNFFVKRFFRIWPLYVIATIAWSTLYYTQGWTAKIIDLQILKSIFFIPKDGVPFYSIGWTLDIEIVFYLIFATSIIFGKYKWTYLIATAFLIYITKDAQHQITEGIASTSKLWAQIVSRIFNPHFLEFYTGIVIGLAYPKLRLINKNISISIILICTSFFLWQYSLEFKAHAGFYGWGIGCTSLFIAVVIYGEHFKTPKFFVWLGKISYSLYLLHTIVYHALRLTIDKVFGEGYTSGLGYFSFSLSIIFILSWASQAYIETRLSNFIKSKYIEYSYFIFKKITKENKLPISNVN
ncbi:acyltransferase family protein [Comamonas terrigena]|uniref:acyltransferase family protein n=1 Tax=Comamonas terrigena TaxID=32013 RepID=UPI002352AB5C|nr:acyltransferase [Comamonas terrigena]